MAELEELYELKMPDWEERSVPDMPADDLMKTLLIKNPNDIWRYHTHESLLDNKEEAELSDAEKQAAWSEYNAANQEEPKPKMVCTFCFLYFVSHPI